MESLITKDDLIDFIISLDDDDVEVIGDVIFSFLANPDIINDDILGDTLDILKSEELEDSEDSENVYDDKKDLEIDEPDDKYKNFKDIKTDLDNSHIEMPVKYGMSLTSINPFKDKKTVELSESIENLKKKLKHITETSEVEGFLDFLFEVKHFKKRKSDIKRLKNVDTFGRMQLAKKMKRYYQKNKNKIKMKQKKYRRKVKAQPYSVTVHI